MAIRLVRRGDPLGLCWRCRAQPRKAGESCWRCGEAHATWMDAFRAHVDWRTDYMMRNAEIVPWTD